MAVVSLDLSLHIEGSSVFEAVEISKALLTFFEPIVNAAHATGRVNVVPGGPQLSIVDPADGTTMSASAGAAAAFRREIARALDSEHDS